MKKVAPGPVDGETSSTYVTPTVRSYHASQLLEACALAQAAGPDTDADDATKR